MSATVLTRKQVKTYGPKRITFTYGEPSFMNVEVRYDDECGNGHNSFAITADIRPVDHRRGGGAGGCLHDEVAKHFPELAPFIKWHLCSSDGPMHYIANTVYKHAWLTGIVTVCKRRTPAVAQRQERIASVETLGIVP